MTSSLVARLAKIDSCAVSDALDALKIAGVALDLNILTVRRRIVGEAITVQLGLAQEGVAKRHLCTAAVEAAGPGKIIVIAHNAITNVAGWGGLLSLGASARGLEGVVIDGACRDVDEAIDLDLPIYGRAGVPITARSRVMERDWNVPVTVCGVAVSPNDLVIADSSGVVFIPQARAEEVINRAEAIFQNEARMAADVRDGKPISQVMGHNYESMLTQKT